MLFEQRSHFVQQCLVAARSFGEECHADLRVTLQGRMVEPFDLPPAIRAHTVRWIITGRKNAPTNGVMAA